MRYLSKSWGGIKIYLKKISVLSTIICFSILICIGAVCAVNDTGNGSIAHSNGLGIDNVNNDILAVEHNVNEVNNPIEKTSNSQGTFDDLKNDLIKIKSGDTYNFTKDYTFKLNGPTPYWNKVIKINADNITINGNGHTINAGGANEKLAIFKIVGDNVKITNLTFINSNPNDRMSGMLEKQRIQSPITWLGNNGTLSDCTFAQNSATCGGALLWSGDNGTISKCKFINNTAFGVGGAMYIIGSNNLIENCTFINSTSQLTGESIYYDRKCMNYNRLNSTLNSLPFIEGYKSNIDVNYLYNIHNIQFSDKTYNMASLIYTSITKGGVITLENGIVLYARYFNQAGTFILTLQRNYDSGVVYIKDIYFNNIKNFNDVFNALEKGNYTDSITLVKNIVITGNVYPYSIFGMTSAEMEYLNAITTTSYSSFEPIFKSFTTEEKEKIIERIMLKTTGFGTCNNIDLILNINFKKAFTICSAAMDLSKLGFTTVLIDGNGSTFYANSGDHDENKWAIIGKCNTLIATNMILQKFNTAIENIQGGQAILSHMKFDQNRMDYTIDRDWGAAIINNGLVVCTDCVFTNNYAKNGGAIFNQGLLILNNTEFAYNVAYGSGNDICVGKGGQLIIDGKNITESTSNIYFGKGFAIRSAIAWGLFIVAMAGLAGLIAATCAVSAGILSPFIVGIAAGLSSCLIGEGLLSAWIISYSYDINYNRLQTVLVTTLSLGTATGLLPGYA